jgi:hypothetical protein
MRAILLFPLAALAACAAPSPKDMEKLPAAEVCYRAMAEPSQKEMAQAEISRRSINCQEHTAEIKKIQDMEQRLGGTGGGVGEGTPKPSGGMGGGRY